MVDLKVTRIKTPRMVTPKLCYLNSEAIATIDSGGNTKGREKTVIYHMFTMYQEITIQTTIPYQLGTKLVVEADC
jgi:hypothetical protein